MHRAIALPLAAIMLALMLNAAAAQDAPPLDPIPTPTGTSTAAILAAWSALRASAT